MDETRIDLMKLPGGLFRSRTALVEQVLPAVHVATLEFIEMEYADRERLEDALAFALYNLDETPSASIDALSRLGFFPWVEASWEFDRALTNTLAANYKAAYDCLRRALELSVVAAFFLSSLASAEDASDWLTSRTPTPFLNASLKRLQGTARWTALASRTNWPEQLVTLYHRLSDVVHTRGLRHAAQSLQPSSVVIGAHHLAAFDRKACTAILDTMLETVALVGVVVALTNPTLLVGLPIDEKFGLNPPASGLFNDGQAERLRSIVPEGLRPYLFALAATDEESTAMTAWVNSRPDLTAEEVNEQVRRFREDFGPRV